MKNHLSLAFSEFSVLIYKKFKTHDRCIEQKPITLVSQQTKHEDNRNESKISNNSIESKYQSIIYYKNANIFY